MDGVLESAAILVQAFQCSQQEDLSGELPPLEDKHDVCLSIYRVIGSKMQTGYYQAIRTRSSWTPLTQIASSYI
jgi:hypothetical protein